MNNSNKILNEIPEINTNDYREDFVPPYIITEEEVESVFEDEAVFRKIFCKHMNNFSFMNEKAITILFYQLLSIVTKDLPITLNKQKIPLRLHFLWCQDSGSGKGEAISEFRKIVDVYNNIAEEEEVPQINYVVMSNQESVESLYTSFPRIKDGQYNTDIIKPGLFEKDLLIMNECSELFVEKRGQKQAKSEAFLLALDDKNEGELFEKTILGYNGKSAITKPKCVFVGSTRKVSEMKQSIAESGLFQRTIVYMKDINIETRKKMNRLVLKKKFSSKTQERIQENVEINRTIIAQLFIDYRKKIEEQLNFCFENEENALQFGYYNNEQIMKDVIDYLSIKEHQSIANSFLSRTTNKIILISLHNAALRDTTKISLLDIKVANNIVMGSFNDVVSWIEDSVNEKPIVRLKKNNLLRVVKELYTLKEEYKLSDLIKHVQKNLKITRCYASTLVRELWVGEYSILKNKNNILRMKQKINNYK